MDALSKKPDVNLDAIGDKNQNTAIEKLREYFCPLKESTCEVTQTRCPQTIDKIWLQKESTTK